MSEKKNGWMQWGPRRLAGYITKKKKWGEGEVSYRLRKWVDRALGHFVSEPVDLYAEV